MTRDEALRECLRLGREHPDRATASWMATTAEDGAWTVVRVDGLGTPPPRGTLVGEAVEPIIPQPDPLLHIHRGQRGLPGGLGA